MKKLKMFFVFMFVMVMLVSTVSAGPEPGLIAAGAGYLSSVDYVAVAFNAYAGQQIIFSGLPMDYLSTVGLCVLSNYSSMGSILGYGDTTISRVAPMPVDDLYVYLCLRLSGFSGNFAIVASDYNTIAGLSSAKAATAVELSTRSAESVSGELKDRLRRSLLRAFEQLSGK